MPPLAGVRCADAPSVHAPNARTMAIESSEHAGDRRFCPTSLFIGGPISGGAFWLPHLLGVNRTMVDPRAGVTQPEPEFRCFEVAPWRCRDSRTPLRPV